MNVDFAQGDWVKKLQDFFVTIAKNKTLDVPTKKYMLVTVEFPSPSPPFLWIRLTGLILFGIGYWKKMIEQP
jgi:hypothetical protein